MAGAVRKAPLRGTQTFVGVMVEVWKRPSLSAIEVGWRWLVGLVMLPVLWSAGGVALGGLGMDIHLNDAWFSQMTVFKPAQAIASFASLNAAIGTAAWSVLRWFAPVAMVVWIVGCAVGRTIMLRRYDASLRPKRLVFAVLVALRCLALVVELSLLGWVVGWAGRVMLLRSGEPNLIGFAGSVIVASLLLFAARAAASWVLVLAPLVAMERGCGLVESIRVAMVAKRELRSKLIETNLVMGIVKVALIVLAMVFSASPLPFTNVETQAFLTCWWGGVIVWWLLMSDFFHVVRTVVYLRLWRAYETNAAS